MSTFACSVEVDRPRAELFALMQDYDRRLEWDVFLREARLVGAERAGKGVRAYCVDHAGRGMETEYVSFQPPERAAVKMTKGPWIFKSFAASWAYEELAERRTRVTFRYHMVARIPLTTPILARVFEARMRARLAGMKAALEGALSSA